MLTLLKNILLLPFRIVKWIFLALLQLIIVCVVLAAISVWWPNKIQPLPEAAVLELTLAGDLMEHKDRTSPLEKLLANNDGEPSATVMHDVIQAIDHATHDRHITAISMDLDYLGGAALSDLADIGAALTRFRQSGKKVVAYASVFTQQNYLIASYADEILIYPMGGVELHGFGAYQSYFKGLLDQLNVNIHVFRAGEFKSFVEPFTRSNMSDEARANTGQWLNDLWQQYVTIIDTQRHLPEGALMHYIENLDHLLEDADGDISRLALEHGLVDGIATQAQIRDRLTKLMGNGTEYTGLDYLDYLAHINTEQRLSLHQENEGVVGIIHASGEIVDGDDSTGNITASFTTAELIRTAREDDKVNAIVLRVSSPGGSAFGSEIIRSELALTRQQGIPVVVSMGGVAASGGYWIASASDEIWASPLTITGSIGVFGIIPTFENTLDKIGIHSDGVGTTSMADNMQIDRAMKPEVERTIQSGVEFTYRRFVDIVAESRKKPRSDIDQIARGQVWTGKQGVAEGLVDHLGNLQDAIGAAARLAKLEHYHSKVLEPELSPRDALLAGLFESRLVRSSLHRAMKSTAAFPLLTRMLNELQRLDSQFNDPRHIYATCFNCRVTAR